MAGKEVLPRFLDHFPDFEYGDSKTKIFGFIYSNRIQIILNETGTFGSILHSSMSVEGTIFETNTLLGDRNDEIVQLYAREVLRLFVSKGFGKKDLLLFTSVRKHSVEHLRGTLKHMEKHIVS